MVCMAQHCLYAHILILEFSGALVSFFLRLSKAYCYHCDTFCISFHRLLTPLEKRITTQSRLLLLGQAGNGPFFIIVELGYNVKKGAEYFVSL
jgi:hypothetical protein